MRRVVPRTAKMLGASAVAAALLLTGCTASDGGGGGGNQAPASQDEIDEALSTPTKLTFWTWVPDIQNEVDLFEAEYPEIDVEVVNVGQGAPHYQKIRTAIEAGEGAPDVVQMEYQYINSFALTESLLDLAPYGADELEGDYVDWVWNQVSKDGAVYGIPQDVGPMGNLYREDILAKAGITEAPATWEEYATAAEAVKSATGSYITNFAPNQAGQVIGLLWQAGEKPFSYDGDQTVGVNVNSDRAKEVMAYWQDLVQRDLVSIDPDFTDQWYQGLASGKYAGWLTAAWGPVFLQGTAGETSGLWRAAELPQYAEGESVSGNWGGSSDAVLASTENPIAAYELAKWINNDKASTLKFATEQFLFPPQNDVLEDPAFVDQEAEFYGGQKVNQLFSEISGTVDSDFDWLPYMDYAYSSFEDSIGKAIAEKGDLSAGLDEWQDLLTTYATDQGFTVE
ncbi:ABC transporter substrate-binding protein [Planctomonas deserti]|jgi:multiple sugar transport system substrate-binding protein|uniref:ABC transporter substrate-binding protein n=1 Tax=Planctomonas deserti TaxID=2144185 RepID=UPI001F0C541C|nr:extracellular solute-binding protein [Planctomonas deserti]